MRILIEILKIEWAEVGSKFEVDIYGTWKASNLHNPCDGCDWTTFINYASEQLRHAGKYVEVLLDTKVRHIFGTRRRSNYYTRMLISQLQFDNLEKQMSTIEGRKDFRNLLENNLEVAFEDAKEDAIRMFAR